MSGLTPQGFKRKRYDDLIRDMEARARNLFGEKVNLSERGPLGLFIRLVAWFLAKKWETAEDVYYSAYKDTAEGTSLDNVAANVALLRRQAERATGIITISGENGTAIPKGFWVATTWNVQFESTTAAVIGSSGSVDIQIIAVEAGAIGNVQEQSITVITNPTAGISSATNAEPTIGGRNKETDTEFRDRYDLSIAGSGAATLDSIHGALLRVGGVRAATVVENTSMLPDTAGRPGKSFECYVLGGDPNDVAEAILEKKAAGIETYGTETVAVKDIAGVPREIKFSYANEVQIHIKVKVTKNPRHPADGAQQIKSELIRYIGGRDIDEAYYVGLKMGETVIYTRLISAVFRVAGIDDIVLEVSTNGATWETGNVNIQQNEVAQTSYDIIEVIYT